MRHKGKRLFTWSLIKRIVTPEAARGAFRRLAERGWGQWGRGAEGLRGTDLFLQDPSCQDLPTWYEMLGNVTLQTDVPQLHTENWRSGYTQCIQKDRNEGKAKSSGLRNGGFAEV